MASQWENLQLPHDSGRYSEFMKSNLFSTLTRYDNPRVARDLQDVLSLSDPLYCERLVRFGSTRLQDISVPDVDRVNWVAPVPHAPTELETYDIPSQSSHSTAFSSTVDTLLKFWTCAGDVFKSGGFSLANSSMIFGDSYLQASKTIFIAGFLVKIGAAYNHLLLGGILVGPIARVNRRAGLGVQVRSVTLREYWKGSYSGWIPVVVPYAAEDSELSAIAYALLADEYCYVTNDDRGTVRNTMVYPGGTRKLVFIFDHPQETRAVNIGGAAVTAVGILAVLARLQKFCMVGLHRVSYFFDGSRLCYAYGPPKILEGLSHTRAIVAEPRGDFLNIAGERDKLRPPLGPPRAVAGTLYGGIKLKSKRGEWVIFREIANELSYQMGLHVLNMDSIATSLPVGPLPYPEQLPFGGQRGVVPGGWHRGMPNSFPNKAAEDSPERRLVGRGPHADDTETTHPLGGFGSYTVDRELRSIHIEYENWEGDLELNWELPMFISKENAHLWHYICSQVGINQPTGTEPRLGCNLEPRAYPTHQPFRLMHSQDSTGGYRVPSYDPAHVAALLSGVLSCHPSPQSLPPHSVLSSYADLSHHHYTTLTRNLFRAEHFQFNAFMYDCGIQPLHKDMDHGAYYGKWGPPGFKSVILPPRIPPYYEVENNHFLGRDQFECYELRSFEPYGPCTPYGGLFVDASTWHSSANAGAYFDSDASGRRQADAVIRSIYNKGGHVTFPFATYFQTKMFRYWEKPCSGGATANGTNGNRHDEPNDDDAIFTPTNTPVTLHLVQSRDMKATFRGVEDFAIDILDAGALAVDTTSVVYCVPNA